MGASPTPTPATPTVSGPCSKATALRVAKNPFSTDVRKQFGQVLCGPFTGPGSDAMVVTFNAPTCWSPQGWAVYRRTGGVWRLVMSQPYVFLVAPLVVVGSDIKETRPVFRPGDNRCNPSGGTHARVWHWNGSRLVASAWAQPALVHLDTFLSPDRKIWCRINKDAVENDAWCGIEATAALATVKHSGAVTVCNDSCLQNWDAKAPVLGYGHRSELNGFRCASAQNGITCTVIAGAGKGKGFLITASGITQVG